MSKTAIIAAIILLMLPSLCFSTIGSYVGNDEPRVFPQATFEIQEAIGLYSKEEIKVVADKGMLGLRNIYFKYLIARSDFYGNVLFKFKIAKNGEITKIDMVHSTTGNAEFDETVKNKIATWKWNTKNDSATVTVLFNFTTLPPTKEAGRRAFLINGVRPFRDIFSTLNYHSPGLANIQNKYLKLKPDLDNRIIVIFKFEVTKSGEVTNVDIVASTAEYAEFEEAIKSYVATWKLNPIENGNTTVSVFTTFYKPKPNSNAEDNK